MFVIILNFRFAPFICASYASHVLDKRIGHQCRHRQNTWDTQETWETEEGLAMAQRSSFAQVKAEQARMTESWKAEGRLSEAWAVADPEIVEIFSAGVAFGVEAGRRGRSDPAYSPDEWRRALREAVEKAATLEDKLEKAREAMLKNAKD